MYRNVTLTLNGWKMKCYVTEVLRMQHNPAADRWCWHDETRQINRSTEITCVENYGWEANELVKKSALHHKLKVTGWTRNREEYCAQTWITRNNPFSRRGHMRQRNTFFGHIGMHACGRWTGRRKRDRRCCNGRSEREEEGKKKNAWAGEWMKWWMNEWWSAAALKYSCARS